MRFYERLKKIAKITPPDRYRKPLLAVAVIALSAVYVIMMVDLISIGYDRLPGNDPAVMLRALPYDLMIGALLFAVGMFIKREKRKTKMMFQFIGLWSFGLGVLIGIICLGWMLVSA